MQGLNLQASGVFGLPAMADAVGDLDGSTIPDHRFDIRAKQEG